MATSWQRQSPFSVEQQEVIAGLGQEGDQEFLRSSPGKTYSGVQPRQGDTPTYDTSENLLMTERRIERTFDNKRFKPVKLVNGTRTYGGTLIKDPTNVLMTERSEAYKISFRDAPGGVQGTEELSALQGISGGVQRTETLSALQEMPCSVQKTEVASALHRSSVRVLRAESLPGLHKHWMSVCQKKIDDTLPGLNRHWMSVRQQHMYLSLIFFAVGFSAITALAIAIFGWLSLDILAYLLVWPSLLVWIVLSFLYPYYGKLALKGFVIGLIACFCYDMMRFVAIKMGLWGDFIPNISMWLLHTGKPDWLVGYIWRYVGDGGFMSVAFVVGYRLLKPKLNVCVAAVAFGVAVWGCLVATILLAPRGSEMLFQLTPITFSLSLLGHLIYGLAIGILYPIFIREGASVRRVSESSAELFSFPQSLTGLRREREIVQEYHLKP